MGKLKNLLASVLLLVVLTATPYVQSEAEPPPVESVYFVADTASLEDATVSWTPPAMAATDLARVTYEVYGHANGEDVLVAEVDASILAVAVPPGYEKYGVAVRLDGRLSAVVYGCGVKVTDVFPFVTQTCM